MRNIISYLEYHISEFTESEQAIAQYFINEPKEDELKIVDVAKNLYISTATISRFVKKIGYPNYKSFIHDYSNSLINNKEASRAMNQEAADMWEIHNRFYEKLYDNFSTIDLNYIVNRMVNSKMIYTFGFGKTQEAMNMIIYRLEALTQNIKSVDHYEHLLFTIDHTMDYQSLIIIFYHSEYFSKDVKTILKLAKQKYIPVLIITLNGDIEEDTNTKVIKLYPFKDETVARYAMTMYAPFLLFIDAIYMALYRKLSQNINYQGY